MKVYIVVDRDMYNGNGYAMAAFGSYDEAESYMNENIADTPNIGIEEVKIVP